VESNLNIKKTDTPKLNVETVSSAVFGKDDGAGGGSGESIKNIHKTLSKLSGHIRKSLVRIKALEFNLEKITPKLEEVEKKVIVNAEKRIEVEKKVIVNTEKTTEVEKKSVVNVERIVKIEKILEKKKDNVGGIGGNQKDLTKSLIETNKILVGIRQQLALDSAMRVADQRKKEDVFKRSQSRKKLNAEESALEKTAKNIGKGVKKVVGKVLSPVKNFFADLLDFLLTVGAGIAVNAAFEWLKEPKNREQLDQWFGWVAKNWKWIAGITAGILLLQPILSIVGAIGGAIVTIKAGLDIFNFIRRRLFGGGGKPRSPASTTGGAKPPVGDPGRAGGQSGGFKDPNRYRPPGQTRAGSSFNLEQARKVAPTPGSAVPKGGIFSRFSKIKPGSPAQMMGQIVLGDAFGRAGNFLSNKFDEFQLKKEIELYNNLDDVGKSAMVSEYKKIIQSQEEQQTALGGSLHFLDKYLLRLGGETISEQMIRRREAFLYGIGQRERGGPIAAGKPYLVGEGGPELVVPKISGTVINNMKTEKIYQMISSDMGEGNINMMNLSPITNQMPPPEMPDMGVGEGATEVPEIASVNMANPYRQLTPMLYGITV
jgi:hypothetical protein